jgi:energy-converting hydrogenase Eha subunit A
MFVSIINALISLITLILNGIITLLPDTPFDFAPLQWGSFGHAIGIVFPIPQMATHLTVILSAFLTYYVVRWLLRLIRQIQ